MNGNAPRVWLVDDDAAIRWVLERALRNGGMTPRSFEAAEPVLDALTREAPDVLLTDIQMPGQSGLQLLKKIRDTCPSLPVIVMTAYSDVGTAISSYDGGAFEYLAKPLDLDQAVALVRRAAHSRPQPEDVPGATRIPKLLGRSPAMQQVFRAIGRLARSNLTVLITGESGTGKGLLARTLHNHSPLAGRPFITVNTTAIAPKRLELDLFGYEKGAFTGADAQCPGRLEQADGGTLFLKEIDALSPALQTRLLRVFIEGELYRIGGQTPVQTTVRVIAATEENLQDRVTGGAFREDLYHHLNVIRIELPPLRTRSEDIPTLLEHYLKMAACELGVRSKTLTKDAEVRLVAYQWPGNVRELVNLCRRVTALAPGSEIESGDLPPELGRVAAATVVEVDWRSALSVWAQRQAMTGTQPLLDEAVPELERVLIQAALKRTAGHRAEAAKLLGWGRNTLTQKIRDLGIGGVEEEVVGEE